WRRNIEFIQPPAPPAVLQTENASRIGDADRFAVRYGRKDKALLRLGKQLLQSCDKLVLGAFDVMLRELHFKQRGDGSNLLGFNLPDREFGHLNCFRISPREIREVDSRWPRIRQHISLIDGTGNSQRQ